LSYIDLAVKEGGKILIGGKRARLLGSCEQGWFVEPTLIEGLPNDCRTNQEEIFGPIATLMPFKKEEQVLEWANSTRYGLAATVWTRICKGPTESRQNFIRGLSGSTAGCFEICALLLEE